MLHFCVPEVRQGLRDRVGVVQSAQAGLGRAPFQRVGRPRSLFDVPAQVFAEHLQPQRQAVEGGRGAQVVDDDRQPGRAARLIQHRAVGEGPFQVGRQPGAAIDAAAQHHPVRP